MANNGNNYIKRLEAKLERIDRESQGWLTQARESTRPGSHEERMQITTLRNQIARLRADLNRIGANNAVILDDEKAHLDRSWNEIKASYHSTVRNFQ